jgi:hypothetical protein
LFEDYLFESGIRTPSEAFGAGQVKIKRQGFRWEPQQAKPIEKIAYDKQNPVILEATG